MGRFRPLFLVLLAAFALGAVAATGASARKATPGINPSNVLFTAKGGVSLFAASGLLSGAEIRCASNMATGGFTTSLSGTFDVLILGCLVKIVSALFLCTGSNNRVTSSILALGTLHLRYREATGTKSVVAFLLIPVKFVCEEGSTERAYEVDGCVAGEITPVNQNVRTGEHFTLLMTKAATTRDEITKIENEAGDGEETCRLQASENGGAFAEAARAITYEIGGDVSSAEIQA